MLIIVATEKETGDRFECFTWTRDAASGIERAKRDAVRFNMADKLEDYRAEKADARYTQAMGM